MKTTMGFVPSVLVIAVLAAPQAVVAQTMNESRWAVDFALGIDSSINGNVNSGAIGVIDGQTAAILPSTYGDVYGAGIQLRFGGGYMLEEVSELRGVFIFQSADADLVRLGEVGPSGLYAQYGDYQVLSLDFGYRRYFPLRAEGLSLFGEATIGAAFVNNIDVEFAAPESNIIFEDTDFYDQSAAFTMSASVGLAFRVSEQVDLTAALGLRRVGGLSDVDRFEGTGLDNINNDSARLTFPITVGLRFRFR
jgi:hypothetical protein